MTTSVIDGVRTITASDTPDAYRFSRFVLASLYMRVKKKYRLFLKRGIAPIIVYFDVGLGLRVNDARSLRDVCLRENPALSRSRRRPWKAVKLGGWIGV